MTTIILFYIFYIVIPICLAIYAIARLIAISKKAQGVATDKYIDARDKDYLDRLLNLPALMRNDPNQGMVTLGILSDWSSQRIIHTNSLRMLISVLRSTRGGLSKREVSLVTPDELKSELANSLEQALYAIRSNNKAQLYLSLSDMVRLPILANEHKPNRSSGEIYEVTEHDENLLRKLQIVSNLLVNPIREYELNHQIESFKDLHTWKFVSADKGFALHYLSVRVGNYRYQVSLNPNSEYASLISERERVSKLTARIVNGLQTKKYEVIMKLIEDDFDRVSKDREPERRTETV